MFRENEFASITLESSVSLTGISQQVNHDMRKNNGRFVILSTEEGVYIQFSGVSDWERDFIMGVHYAVLVQGIQIPFGDCFDGLDWMTLWTGTRLHYGGSLCCFSSGHTNTLWRLL